MTARYDLIGDVAAALRAALRDAGAPRSALDGLRVMPPHSGDALLVSNIGRLLPDTLSDTLPDRGIWCAPLALPVLGVAHLDAPAASVIVAPAAIRRAVMDLSASVPSQPFPPVTVLGDLRAGAAAVLARLRVRAVLDAAGLADGPDWPEQAEIPADCLPLLRALVGRAREGAAPSAGWTARLRTALDAQWQAGPGPLMRLIDPNRPAATTMRLALAARAAALV